MTNLNVAEISADLVLGRAERLEKSPSTWHAQLELGFSRDANRGTRLVKNRHQGPLYVQKPFYPEGKDTAHVYILHPPGGLVSGDCLSINVSVANTAHALLTTPGAGRVYRARPDHALQQQTCTIDVGKHAIAEWFPLETIIFNGARTRLNTHINLEQGARFFGWEVTSLGLPANGIAFDHGRVQQCLRVNQLGRPVLIERLVIDTAQANPYLDKAGLQGNPVNGVFVAGPFEDITDDEMQVLRDGIAVNPERSYLAGISLVNRFIIGRYLGGCSEQSRQLFTKWWELLRPTLIGREARHPRIWST